MVEPTSTPFVDAIRRAQASQDAGKAVAAEIEAQREAERAEASQSPPTP